MASWYSGILTKTSSQFSSLQSRVFQSENDGDTEDDTHVCRVLRAHYTEKGRPFPAWLPPDPKAPPPVAPVYVQQQQQIGSRYGQPGGMSSAPSGSLSSLWDNSGSQGQRQDAPPSLRQGRVGAQQAGSRLSPFAQQQQAGGGGGSIDQGRPLSGHRAGNPYGSSGTAPGPTGGGSAQDRLKQRLWGGSRTVSPSASGQGPFQPPASGGGGGGGGGGSGDYEDRFAPGGMYDGGSRGGGGGGGSSGGRPYMSANAPWAGGDDQFSNFSGGGGGGGGGRPPVGLPSGPRRGLPSGPRMR